MDITIDDLKTFDDRVSGYLATRDKNIKRIKWSKDGVMLDGHYFIAIERIDTPQKLLAWVYHLSGKNWADRVFLNFFIAIVSEHIGFDIHLLC